jgi:hypothetical protein
MTSQINIGYLNRTLRLVNVAFSLSLDHLRQTSCELWRIALLYPRYVIQTRVEST